jgi:PPOX class probable F420-dependent enzyme
MADGFAIDESTEFGARAAAHLRDDLVVWLTTVSPSGVPQPSPVWFRWDGADQVLVYSRAGTPRSRNLEAAPAVSLNFAGDGAGGDIVVLSGRAEIADDLGPADADPAYVARYAAGFERLGMTPAQFAAGYPVPVRIRLTGLRGH